MPKIFTVGNEEFEFPLTGENAGYGSEVTDWAEAVTDALSTVQKPNDIPTTAQITLTQQGVGVPTIIPGFVFSTAEVIAIDAKYIFTKSYTEGSVNKVETEIGFIEGYFDLTNWGISIRTTGDIGVIISINNSGQISYELKPVYAVPPSTTPTLAFPNGSTNRLLTVAYEAKVINR